MAVALLTFTTNQAASVTLAWDPSPDADVVGYRLYYSAPALALNTNRTLGAITNYTLTDLQPGVTYTFHVTCYNSSGLESEPSNSVEYSVPTEGPNQPPEATSTELRVKSGGSLDIILQGTDPEHAQLSFWIQEAPSYGTYEGIPYPPYIRYQAPLDYEGWDYLTFSVSDGFLDSEPALVKIFVHPNSLPETDDQLISLNEDESVLVSLYARDNDGDPLTFELLTQPQHGSLSGALPDVLYQPIPGFTGHDQFTYRAGDGQAWSAPATVLIEVVAVFSPPSVNAGPDQYLIRPAEALLRATVTHDPQAPSTNAASRWTQITGPAEASILQADALLTLVQFPQPGSYVLRVTASDGASSAFDDVTVNVDQLPVRPDAEIVTLLLQAESGIRTGNLLAFTNSDPAHVVAPDRNPGELILPFTVQQAGRYIAWCRVRTPGPAADFFLVTLPGATPAEDIYDCAWEQYGDSWKWTPLCGRGGTSLNFEFAYAHAPRPFDLTVGPHELVFRTREANTALDAVIVTNDPEFNPSAAEQSLELHTTLRPDGQIMLSWLAMPGRRYEVLEKRDLESPWTGAGNLVTADSSRAQWTTTPHERGQFFKVILLP